MALLAGARLPAAAVIEALRGNRMIDELLRESGVAALWREEGKHEIARLALAARFGALSDDIVSALQKADDTTLVAVLTHLATDTREQVRERLGLS
jgi:hypothetical protein